MQGSFHGSFWFCALFEWSGGIFIDLLILQWIGGLEALFAASPFAAVASLCIPNMHCRFDWSGGVALPWDRLGPLSLNQWVRRQEHFQRTPGLTLKHTQVRPFQRVSTVAVSVLPQNEMHISEVLLTFPFALWSLFLTSCVLCPCGKNSKRHADKTFEKPQAQQFA